MKYLPTNSHDLNFTVSSVLARKRVVWNAFFLHKYLSLMYLLKSTLYQRGSFVQPNFHWVKSSSFTRDQSKRSEERQHHWKLKFVLCFAQLGHSTFKILIKNETAAAVLVNKISEQTFLIGEMSGMFFNEISIMLKLSSLSFPFTYLFPHHYH